MVGRRRASSTSAAWTLAGDVERAEADAKDEERDEEERQAAGENGQGVAATKPTMTIAVGDTRSIAADEPADHGHGQERPGRRG